MRELRLLLSPVFGFLILLGEQFDYLLLRVGNRLVLGLIVGLYKNQIQYLRNLNIHIFNIIDAQLL